MKRLLLIINMLLLSCGQKSKDYGAIPRSVNDSLSIDSFINIQSDTNKTGSTPPVTDDFLTGHTDSMDLRSFWNYAIVPILKKDKRAVLKTIHFPLGGDWANMLGLGKFPEEATAEEFLFNYDRLFTQEFLQKLSEQSFRDISVNYTENKIWEYQVGVNKDFKRFEGGGGIILHYAKFNNRFQLITFQGVGGDFYYDY